MLRQYQRCFVRSLGFGKEEGHMKISLIHPPSLIGKNNYSSITQPPIGLAYLASYLSRKGHQVQVIDAFGEGLDNSKGWEKNSNFLVRGLPFDDILRRIDKDSQVIGFSIMFTHSWPMVRELVKLTKIKFSNIPLIAGGEHVSGMYQLVLKESPITVCVIGEGEETLSELLDAFEKKQDFKKIEGLVFKDTNTDEIEKTPCRPRIRDIDSIPWPSWDQIDPMKYLKTKVYIGPTSGRAIPMIASRGCPYQCTFCTSSNMWKNIWKPRNVKDVVDEMQHYTKIYDANEFQLQDLNTVVNKKWIVGLCEEIINRSLNITWQIPVGTSPNVIDKEVSELLKKSGCRYVQLAPESGSERILKLIKKSAKLKDVEKAADCLIKTGIITSAMFIVGFPDETMEDIKKTFSFIRSLARKGIHEIAVSNLVPLPCTEIFEDIQKRTGIVFNDDYCYWMTGATSLSNVKSWNPNISDNKLKRLRIYALLQFYLISYLLHPNRVVTAIKNLVKGKQETKIDRIIIEAMEKIKLKARINS